MRSILTVASTLHRKLGVTADNPTHIYIEPHVGYPMPKERLPGPG